MRRLRKNASMQVYPYLVTTTSSSSDSSGIASSETSDTPLKRFNRLMRSSVARPWTYFRKDRSALRDRGRSVSDAGLCTTAHRNGPELAYLDIPPVSQRRSLQTYATVPANLQIPEFTITSAGGGGAGAEEASDSDAERPRKHHHLRVPTPAFPTQSTGNFAAGGAGAGGGCGEPRSAPATPLQPDSHSRHKHDKHAVKPLSGSTPSVRAETPGGGGGAGELTDGAKLPYKSRQKKFQRHFPQVGPDERVLNYYAAALVGDILLQGHLYITKNYFAFYSNVFGYVTKLLIPVSTVLRITKEKVARIIPNAVGVCTRDERHVFGSLLSRDSTYKLMTHVWKTARAPDISVAKPAQELHASEVELDASEYSPEDDSSSVETHQVDAPLPPAGKREPDSLLTTSGGPAVIQPALLTGGAAGVAGGAGGGGGGGGRGRGALLLLLALLAASAALSAYRLLTLPEPQEHLLSLSGEELVRWRARLHGRAASELHAFLSANLMLLTKVRQSLEALSSVILTDMAADLPNDTAFS